MYLIKEPVLKNYSLEVNCAKITYVFGSGFTIQLLSCDLVKSQTWISL